MDKVVDQQHAQEGVEPLGGDVVLEHAAAVLDKVGEGDALGELLDQHGPGGELEVRGREGGGARVARRARRRIFLRKILIRVNDTMN